MSTSINYDSSAVGKRKTSVARVYLKSGKGEVKINKRPLKDYLPNPSHRVLALRPLDLLKVQDRYDLNVNVSGGGLTGQASAIRLGVARALMKIDPTVRKALKVAGLITRDSRIVERKKYGLRGARRSFQFSKR